MGLLAPLYALAALAIVGPIVFHLIRRQPQGQMLFSSLIFLSPSPPRLTRRSRLDNLLLLLLRALAIALIALAFARPYLRQQSFFNSTLAGRNIVVVLDTSASMQRDDVWQSAMAKLTQLLDSLSPEDRIALYTIDDAVRPIVPLEAEQKSSPAASAQAVRTAMAKLAPSWKRTELADGLKTVADMLSAASIAGQIDATAENEIVLISDLHLGSGLESLQGFPWPESIQLDVRQILPALPGNARPSLMLATEDDRQVDETENASGAVTKIRIENNRDSKEQAFELAWFDPQGAITNAATTVQVPAGQVRVVPISTRPSGATHLQLLGDAWAGDNSVYIVQTTPARQPILSYFLKKAPLDTPLFHREIVMSTPNDLATTGGEYAAIFVEPVAANEEFAGTLRELAVAGSTIVVCLARAVDDPQPLNAFLQRLTASPEISVTEASVKNYSLLSAIDYTHPVFAPFADPRFNDFSKLRFWNHRRLQLPADEMFRVVASYDDQTPMLVENRVGKGRVWIMTCGWQPSSSGLALSSKFVPILLSMLDPRGRSQANRNTFEVGESVDISDIAEDFDGQVIVLNADGSPTDSRLFAARAAEIELYEPGIFRVQAGELSRQIAIQVPASESQQLPLDTDVFEQYGIKLGKVAADAERREASRQLQVEELEIKQRLWQWLIVAGLAVLAIETWLAGNLARRHARQLAAS